MEDINPRKVFDDPKPPSPDYTKSESEINQMIQESKWLLNNSCRCEMAVKEEGWGQWLNKDEGNACSTN